ncbi:hypothetical protein M918_08145 [Clostridium sp. BL8]|nr:hypothetical protein M918_08145 [Clostridium sp. BL8]
MTKFYKVIKEGIMKYKVIGEIFEEEEFNYDF